MGMSTPKTKTEAREQIASLQAKLAKTKASLANYKAQHGKKNDGFCESQMANKRNEIARIQGDIAKIKAQMSSLPK